MKSVAFLFCLLTAVMVIPAPARAADPASGRHLFSTLVADPGFSAAWAGVWDLTITQKDCDTGDTLQIVAEQDTICTGNTINTDPGSFSITCDGTSDDTNFNVTCTGSSEVITDCIATFTYTVDGTRSGDNMSATSRITIVYSGTACSGIADFCQDSVISGTRTGPEPPDCGLTPVLPATWGRLKARYTD